MLSAALHPQMIALVRSQSTDSPDYPMFAARLGKALQGNTTLKALSLSYVSWAYVPVPVCRRVPQSVTVCHSVSQSVAGCVTECHSVP